MRDTEDKSSLPKNDSGRKIVFCNAVIFMITIEMYTLNVRKNRTITVPSIFFFLSFSLLSVRYVMNAASDFRALSVQSKRLCSLGSTNIL